jgi:hypothetical protein
VPEPTSLVLLAGVIGYVVFDERKRMLRKLLPRRSQAVLYVEHVENGSDLFQAICEQDMEGVVAKQANARYTPEARFGAIWHKRPSIWAEPLSIGQPSPREG